MRVRRDWECVNRAFGRVSRTLDRAQTGFSRGTCNISRDFFENRLISPLAIAAGVDTVAGQSTRNPRNPATPNLYFMNDRETRRYDMFGRVQTSRTDNTADFAAGGEGKKRFGNVA